MIMKRFLSLSLCAAMIAPVTASAVTLSAEESTVEVYSESTKEGDTVAVYHVGTPWAKANVAVPTNFDSDMTFIPKINAAEKSKHGKWPDYSDILYKNIP